MNKKLLITFLIGVFTLVTVNAGLMVYYGQVIENVEVTQPITVTGNLEYVIKDAMAGDTVKGYRNMISNIAGFPVSVAISSDNPDRINAIYSACVPSACINGGSSCSWRPIPENNTITIPPQCYAYFEISYELDSMLETGTYTITTTIDEFE